MKRNSRYHPFTHNKRILNGNSSNVYISSQTFTKKCMIPKGDLWGLLMNQQKLYLHVINQANLNLFLRSVPLPCIYLLIAVYLSVLHQPADCETTERTVCSAYTRMYSCVFMRQTKLGHREKTLQGTFVCSVEFIYQPSYKVVIKATLL